MSCESRLARLKAQDGLDAAEAGDADPRSEAVTCRPGNGWYASAKIRRLMGLLRDIHSEDPVRKTIIFSQFTSMLDLIEVPLKRAGYRYVRCTCPRHTFVKTLTCDR